MCGDRVTLWLVYINAATLSSSNSLSSIFRPCQSCKQKRYHVRHDAYAARRSAIYETKASSYQVYNAGYALEYEGLHAYSPEDQAILEAAYKANSKPDRTIRAEIASQVSLGEKEISVSAPNVESLAPHVHPDLGACWTYFN